MNKDEPQQICSICQREYTGFGNNAEPINNGRCCNKCNALVIQARLHIIWRADEQKKGS